MAGSGATIDDLDRLILELLVANARRSFSDIGDRIGLSPSGVKRRVSRLEHLGVISAYSARVDPRALGFGFDALCEVYCAEGAAPTDVREFVQAMPETVEAMTLAGQADILVRLRVRDLERLESLIDSLHRHESVGGTRVALVLSSGNHATSAVSRIDRRTVKPQAPIR